MLDLPRYLLGVAEILLLAGFATLGAAALRTRLLPAFTGAPALLATVVLALATLILTAELLGSVGLFEPVPYLVCVAAVGLGTWLGVGRGWGRPHPSPRKARSVSGVGGWSANAATFVALAIAAAAVVKFGIDVKPKLTTGMTGFDSTWYHGPFAAGFFQSGDTWGLHFIAPQFLAWFYPANAEIFHGVGMLAFGRDVLSPLLNLGWFVGCLLACWCIGRPYGVAPWSLALGAIALSLPVLSDQAGEARNDIVGIFLLLAAVAIALNAGLPGNGQTTAAAQRGRIADRIAGTSTTALAVAGLAAGLAAGAKLNFLLPAAVLVLGLALVAPAGRRWRAFGFAGLAALAGGGYWYLRNLAHSGNPLPWFTEIGPISLPGPEQELGGREGHSVLGYLFDGAVWSDWFLPGLSDGLTVLWPPLLALALAGLLLAIWPARGTFVPHSDIKEPRPAKGLAGGELLTVAGLTGIAALVTWLIAPTSASGPDGIPRGFESGLRYLAPALVLGLAVLPATLLPRVAWGGAPGKARRPFFAPTALAVSRRLPWRKTQRRPGAPPHDRTRGPLAFVAALVLLSAIAIGYPVQRHYLENRYADPTFAAPGLNAAFAWSRDLSNVRIATTATRQYPLYGTALSNHVQFLGEPRPQGGFVAPTTCPQYRRLLNAGDYDYVIATSDRLEPDKPPYPPAAAWTEGPGVRTVLRKPPTVVFELSTPLDPSACRR